MQIMLNAWGGYFLTEVFLWGFTVAIRIKLMHITNVLLTHMTNVVVVQKIKKNTAV